MSFETRYRQIAYHYNTTYKHIFDSPYERKRRSIIMRHLPMRDKLEESNKLQRLAEESFKI